MLGISALSPAPQDILFAKAQHPGNGRDREHSDFTV
jgi:hypothetical protein